MHGVLRIALHVLQVSRAPGDALLALFSASTSLNLTNFYPLNSVSTWIKAYQSCGREPGD